MSPGSGSSHGGPRLLHVVGARPNLPKLAPVHRAAARRGLRQTVVHTGQHYDDALSAAFFRDLDLPTPDINLEVGSHSHAVQTARVMERLEPVVEAESPDWVVVYGDVNSTLAAALVAAKLGVPTAHVEAGLRSGDRQMPEEINRIVADRLGSLLLTPSRDAEATLRQEGEPAEEIVFVGNVMIDSMLHALPRARAVACPWRALDVRPVVVTLHRPSNVDDPARLTALGDALSALAAEWPVVFPLHPRTRERLRATGVSMPGVTVVDPLAYDEMLALVDTAHAVITDSGGLQEETTVLGVPCFTVRETTERPITIREGTNTMVWDPARLHALVAKATRQANPVAPEGWDGKAAERIVDALVLRQRVRVSQPSEGGRSSGPATERRHVDNSAIGGRSDSRGAGTAATRTAVP
jgi:UDP-N-acetylglucosamine 2-epimerase (non-hydrolysing)